jgi:GTP cyclohydrolase FolE2
MERFNKSPFRSTDEIEFYGKSFCPCAMQRMTEKSGKLKQKVISHVSINLRNGIKVTASTGIDSPEKIELS